jgi:predicted kinase
MGLPGAGKTALAQRLAEELHWPIVDRDAVPRRRFDEAGKAAATTAVFEKVALLLSREQSCILDGMTFADAQQRERLRALARVHQAQCVFLWLDLPVDVAADRVRAQQDHPALDRDEALVRDVAERFAPPGADVLRLDATLPQHAIGAAALRLLA